MISTQRSFPLHPAIQQKYAVKWLGQTILVVGLGAIAYLPLDAAKTFVFTVLVLLFGVSMWAFGAFRLWYAHIDSAQRRVWSPLGELRFEDIDRVEVRILNGGGAFFIWLFAGEQELCMRICHFPWQAHSTAFWLAQVIGVDAVELNLPSEPRAGGRPVRVEVSGDVMTLTDTHLGFPVRRWTIDGRGDQLTLRCRGWSLREVQIKGPDILGFVVLPQGYVTGEMWELVGTGVVEVLTAGDGAHLGSGLSDAGLAWLAQELRERLAWDEGQDVRQPMEARHG